MRRKKRKKRRRRPQKARKSDAGREFQKMPPENSSSSGRTCHIGTAHGFRRSNWTYFTLRHTGCT